MSINKECQQNCSSNASKDNESDFQFYGGMIWKQTEYSSLYHYRYMQKDVTPDEGNQYYLINEDSEYRLEVKKAHNYL